MEKWPFWRCIPYWKWGFSIAMFDYRSVLLCHFWKGASGASWDQSFWIPSNFLKRTGFSSCKDLPSSPERSKPHAPSTWVYMGFHKRLLVCWKSDDEATSKTHWKQYGSRGLRDCKCDPSSNTTTQRQRHTQSRNRHTKSELLNDRMLVNLNTPQY